MTYNIAENFLIVEKLVGTDWVEFEVKNSIYGYSVLKTSKHKDNIRLSDKNDLTEAQVKQLFEDGKNAYKTQKKKDVELVKKRHKKS